MRARRALPVDGAGTVPASTAGCRGCIPRARTPPARRGSLGTAAERGATVRALLAGLDDAQCQQVVTLPASIGRLTAVRELHLYGTHLVRLPPEIVGDAEVILHYGL